MDKENVVYTTLEHYLVLKKSNLSFFNKMDDMIDTTLHEISQAQNEK